MILLIAYLLGSTELVGLLCDAGAPLEITDHLECTPLTSAVFMGHAQAAAILIEKGSDVNAVNKDGMTPLHWVLSQSFEVIIFV
jgi:ankyrin repeat protein